ncbi:hypothetical protein PF005_g17815 [Phytophthora fragariae]|uniref:Secreted protein n=1 Tax=Phytophthora fragariae TaxID=53985 RepID=A0A6A3T1E2_9STRA|nr:hypothetical protein PF003_g5041 [Phytophthora fragariae]KAE8931516.1 hypothetical protein PF009_g18425 [Phytophthora fragariae]KAE8994435.1 hypothetical protein PF011_g16737 [Phytophthora fragariae]KAE9094955.1 hypothetical protein PF010_g16895 [Phytophthora fragariae]KAE9095149.1 hypothetical protein PF007_g17488 [Phytophthora fragariae]
MRLPIATCIWFQVVASIIESLLETRRVGSPRCFAAALVTDSTGPPPRAACCCGVVGLRSSFPPAGSRSCFL